MKTTLRSSSASITLTLIIFSFLSPRFLTAGSLHPLCLDPLVEQSSSDSTLTSLDLRACQKRYSHLVFDQKNPWSASFSAADQVPDGFLTKKAEEAEDLPSFAAYNVIGQLENQQILIHYVVDYGGSGTFTYGFLLKGMDLDDFTHLDETLATKKRSTNLQLTKRFEGGDRCFGGITHMGIESPDKVSITRNITSYDLLGLGVPKDQQAKNHGDLPGCARCCVGQYTEIIQLDGASGLQDVRLSGARLERNNTQSEQLECLAGLVDAKSHNVILNRKELQDLQQNYAKQCAEPTKPERIPGPQSDRIRTTGTKIND